MHAHGLVAELVTKQVQRQHVEDTAANGHKQVPDVSSTLFGLKLSRSINTGDSVHVTSLTSVVIIMLF